MKFKGLKKEKRAKRVKKAASEEVKEKKVIESPIKREVTPTKKDKTTAEAKYSFFSPSIYRLITDMRLWLISGMVTILCLVGIFLVSSLHEARKVAQERRVLATQEHLLLQKNNQYPGDKDILIRLAMVSYQLHDNKAAEKYIQAIYKIDPAFAPAKTLEKVIEY